MKSELGTVRDFRKTPEGLVFIAENGTLTIKAAGSDVLLFEYNISTYDVPRYLNDAIKEVYDAFTFGDKEVAVKTIYEEVD